MNPESPDPYEEERRARVGRPIQALLEVLGTVAKELLIAQRAATIRESGELFSEALDLLYSALNQSCPLAMRKSARGRDAFLWSDNGGTDPPAFRWLVCFPDGSSKRGAEQSQEDCERAVDGHLRA